MSEMLRVFIGYDPRQPLAYNVLQHSIVRHASVPVAITPLILSQLPIKRRGLTEFTYSRFLVPWLCDYKGLAVFMDADMVVKDDIKLLFDSWSNAGAVSVMKEQPQFEHASVMLFSCGQCRNLTPEFVDDPSNKMFDLAWAPTVGSIPQEWNHCVGYMEPKDAALYHYTQGLPCFPETRGLPEDQEWDEERRLLTNSVNWNDLMGRSIHREPVLRRMLSKYD
jgi:hypothetical protein